MTLEPGQAQQDPPRMRFPPVTRKPAGAGVRIRCLNTPATTARQR